jgi:hypothetical protein
MTSTFGRKRRRFMRFLRVLQGDAAAVKGGAGQGEASLSARLQTPPV